MLLHNSVLFTRVFCTEYAVALVRRATITMPSPLHHDAHTMTRLRFRTQSTIPARMLLTQYI